MSARYRTHVRTLLQEMLAQSGIDDIAIMNKRHVAKVIGVSHQTFYEWLMADSDEPSDWLVGYHSTTETKFREFFARRLGRSVDEIELRTVMATDPKLQEREQSMAAIATV